MRARQGMDVGAWMRWDEMAGWDRSLGTDQARQDLPYFFIPTSRRWSCGPKNSGAHHNQSESSLEGGCAEAFEQTRAAKQPARREA